MFFRYAYARVVVVLFAGLAQAQQTPPPDVGSGTTPTGSAEPRTDPEKRLQRPLTPQEERDRAIRRYDPRSILDPVDKQQDTGLGASPSPGQRDSGTLTQRPLPAPRALPGSVAAGQPDFVNPRSQGPQILDPNQSDNSAPDYSGPAVLSRSYTLSRPTVPREAKLTPSLGFSEGYDTGVGAIITPGVTPTARGSLVTTFTWNVSGRQTWKRDIVGINYSGNYSRYVGARLFNGGNHSVSLQYNHALSRHLSFGLAQSAISTTQSQSLLSNALPADTSIANVNLALSPVSQPIDYGSRQASTQGNLTWRKSARTSVDFGGGFFYVDRTGITGAARGTTGTQAQAELKYRYSRKVTVGTYFSYTNYVFSKHASVSNSTTFGGLISYALDRATQVRLRTGITQLETESLYVVRFPVELIPILGQVGGIAVLYQQTHLQDVSAEFSHDFGRQTTARVSYARGVAPGNGVLLTSTHEALSGSFSLKVFRRYSANVSFMDDTLAAIETGTNLTFTNRVLQFSISRPHSHGMVSHYSIDWRSFTTLGSTVPQTQLRFTTGVSWSPGEGKLWK